MVWESGNWEHARSSGLSMRREAGCRAMSEQLTLIMICFLFERLMRLTREAQFEVPVSRRQAQGEHAYEVGR